METLKTIGIIIAVMAAAVVGLWLNDYLFKSYYGLRKRKRNDSNWFD